MSGTRVAVVKKVWHTMIDGRINDRLAAESASPEDRIAALMAGMEQRLGSRMAKGLSETRVELKEDIHKVEQNLNTTRVELKERIHKVEQYLNSTRAELKDDMRAWMGSKPA